MELILQTIGFIVSVLAGCFVIWLSHNSDGGGPTHA